MSQQEINTLYPFLFRRLAKRLKKQAAKGLDYVLNKTRIDRLPKEVALKLQDLLNIRQALKSSKSKEELAQVERKIEKLLSQYLQGSRYPYNYDELKLGADTGGDFRTVYYQYSMTPFEKKKVLERNQFFPKNRDPGDSPHWTKEEVHTDPKSLPEGESDTLSGWRVDNYIRFKKDYLPKIRQLQQRKEDLQFDKEEILSLKDKLKSTATDKESKDKIKSELWSLQSDYHNEMASFERDEAALTQDLRNFLEDPESVYYDLSSFEIVERKDKHTGKEEARLLYKRRRPTKKERSTNAFLYKDDVNYLKDVFDVKQKRKFSPERLSDFLVGTTKALYEGYIKKLQSVPISKKISHVQLENILNKIVQQVDSQIKTKIEDRGLNVIDDSEISREEQIYRHETMNDIFLKAFEDYQREVSNSIEDDVQEESSGIQSVAVRRYYEWLINDLVNQEKPREIDEKEITQELNKLLKQVNREVHQKIITDNRNYDDDNIGRFRTYFIGVLDDIFDRAREQYNNFVEQAKVDSQESWTKALKSSSEWYNSLVGQLDRLGQDSGLNSTLVDTYKEDAISELKKELKKNFLRSELNTTNPKSLSKSEKKELDSYLKETQRNTLTKFTKQLKDAKMRSDLKDKQVKEREKLKNPRTKQTEEKVTIKDLQELEENRALEDLGEDDLDYYSDSHLSTSVSREDESQDFDYSSLDRDYTERKKSKNTESVEASEEQMWSELGYSQSDDWRNLYSARKEYVIYSWNKLKSVLANRGELKELIPYYVRLVKATRREEHIEKTTKRILKKYAQIKQVEAKQVAAAFTREMTKLGYDIDGYYLECLLNE